MKENPNTAQFSEKLLCFSLVIFVQSKGAKPEDQQMDRW